MEFRAELAKYGAVQSMSGTGRCYDNARMESFFATLKNKIETTKMTAAQVKTIICKYIHYYNRRRIYTTNGGYPPLVYREMHKIGAAA
ncbi:MAG: integrase core domain-containing protein [Oscillospiraceae bacterium]|nr:integrase core domain-containing protein [Oscillospiraceae bacterium]